MKNILDAIINISNLAKLEVDKLTFGNNRINNVGDGLEVFIKNAFSNSFSTIDENEKLENYANTFSYQGSINRPPDLMLKGGDSIEVKKTESIFSELQLNSSHPKVKLFSSSHLINKHCRTCEDWTEKDIIYTIGHIPNKSKTLSSLWFVYGSIYAADENIYTDLKNTITETFEKIESINFSETQEIGRVNYVDPLKITNMRIRGMWLLQPPIKVFDYVYKYNNDLKFQLIAIIPNDKYVSFPLKSREKIENTNYINLEIKNIKVKDPNNPIHLIDCKLITIRK